jgi:dUTP pyrophosphatase
MAEFFTLDALGNRLLEIYGEYMYLKIYVDGQDDIKEKYRIEADKHNNKVSQDISTIDAGFDLYTPKPVTVIKDQVNKIDFQICCAAQRHFYSTTTTEKTSHNTGFYMYPRSSISKSPIRLANNVGIIDAGYRGHVMGMFDVAYWANDIYDLKRFERYVQICAPKLSPIIVEIVETMDQLGEQTARGSGGFGSTGL